MDEETREIIKAVKETMQNSMESIVDKIDGKDKIMEIITNEIKKDITSIGDKSRNLENRVAQLETFFWKILASAIGIPIFLFICKDIISGLIK